MNDVDPRADISSELYGWPRVVSDVREELRLAATPFDPEGHDAAIVGSGVVRRIVDAVKEGRDHIVPTEAFVRSLVGGLA